MLETPQTDEPDVGVPEEGGDDGGDEGGEDGEETA